MPTKVLPKTELVLAMARALPLAQQPIQPGLQKSSRPLQTRAQKFVSRWLRSLPLVRATTRPQAHIQTEELTALKPPNTDKNPPILPRVTPKAYGQGGAINEFVAILAYGVCSWDSVIDVSGAANDEQKYFHTGKLRACRYGCCALRCVVGWLR